MTSPVVQHFFDYKSPYAYLAQHATDSLEREFGITVLRLPYTLDIPSYLGRAEVDAEGRVILEERNAHQWRRVRYAYMDCRREATRRGLVLRGPRKVFNSAPAHMAFLYTVETGDWRRFHDAVFARFWTRELDLEDPAALAPLIELAGADASDFARWQTEKGLARYQQIQQAAESCGVFGVPSWRVDGELFWGSERLDRVGERIAGALKTRAPK